MGSVRLQDVSKQFGPQVVLSGVSLDLHTGEIAALVGPNGVGKTTIFRLIAGLIPPDSGTVTRSRGLEIGYLPQEPDVPAGATLREAVAAAFGELLRLERKLHELSDRIAATADGEALHALMAAYDKVNAQFEAAGGYGFEQRLDEILGGLGFTEAEHALPVSALSGGQKCRAALAKLLLQDCRLLLLDEPTNHLDIDAVRWLEKFLAGHHGGAVIISHDRYLLDRLAQRTIEVTAGPDGARVAAYPGNYTVYVRTREVRRVTQARAYEKDRAFIEKERAYIARHMAGQRSRQAQGRLKRLERGLEEGAFTLDKPSEQRTARIEFADLVGKPQAGKELIRLEGVAKAYEDKRLFAGLDLAVHAGQRIGITGPNGTGKTTLLRIILGHLAPDAGAVHVSSAARIGYFAQEPAALDPAHRIIDAIRGVRPDLLEKDARHVAARFLFTGEEPFKRLGTLSGGEQSRVRFMTLILTAPDLLILDEPTNHLDIGARESLEASLVDFPGTIVTVSHDRYFLDRVVQKLLVIRPEGHRLYGGNYSFYIEHVEQARAAADAARPAARKSAGGSRTRQAPRAADARAQACRQGESPAPPSPYAGYKLPDLEAFITACEGRLARLRERFGDAAVYKDPEKITRLRAKFEQCQADLAAAEEEWLRRAEGG